jgi:hypothetical protein
MREQREVLEHEPDAPRLGRRVAQASEITSPSTSTSPASCRSTPAMMRKVVDLPQPEGPRRHITCPASTDSVTSRTTSRPPKRQVTLRISSLGACRSRGHIPMETVGQALPAARPASRSERRIHPAPVEQDVLPHDEARMDRTEEGAHGAEFLRRAVAAGGDRRLALAPRLLDRDVLLPRDVPVERIARSVAWMPGSRLLIVTPACATCREVPAT